MELGDLDAHLDAQLGVEVAQRLVEQEDARLAHDGAADGDALALSTRELTRLALEQWLDLEDVGGLLHALGDLGLGHARRFETEGQVLVNVHVRVECVGLEHHCNAAAGGGYFVHALAVDQQIAAADRLEPRDHAQQRGLAAAGRADEHGELAWLDAQIDAVDDFDIAVALDHLFEVDPGCGHAKPSGSQL